MATTEFNLDADKELWYVSVIDVIQALTGNDRPRTYWSELKRNLKREGSETSDKVGQLNMSATDTADNLSASRNIKTLVSPGGL